MAFFYCAICLSMAFMDAEKDSEIRFVSYQYLAYRVTIHGHSGLAVCKDLSSLDIRKHEHGHSSLTKHRNLQLSR